MNSETEISYYETVRSDSPDGAAEIKSFIESIRTEEYAEGVAKVRAATTEDEKDAAKLELPAVQISGKVTSGKRKQAIQEGRFEHSGYLQLDVDDDDLNGMTPEDARVTRERDVNDYQRRGLSLGGVTAPVSTEDTKQTQLMTEMRNFLKRMAEEGTAAAF
jgi:hypothetical protein